MKPKLSAVFSEARQESYGCTCSKFPLANGTYNDNNTIITINTIMGDDEGVLVGRERFVPHRVGVDDLTGLALPDVVGLEHDHVVLPATVEIAQSELLGVEADLIQRFALKSFKL